VKLYGYWRSSATWRVRIALNYKALPYELVVVNIVDGDGAHRRAEYHALNPMEQVPTLELDSGERLTQSLAIIDYLEHIAPRPSLYPTDPLARTQALRLAEIVNAGIQPLQNLHVTRAVKALGGDERKWCHDHITRGLTALAESAAPTAGKFLVGDEISIADVCLVPQLYGARRFDVDLSQLSLLTQIEAACAALPAFAAAHPDRQPDAIKS
jgi:maleylpyruvate isomerase